MIELPWELTSLMEQEKELLSDLTASLYNVIKSNQTLYELEHKTGCLNKLDRAKRSVANYALLEYLMDSINIRNEVVTLQTKLLDYLRITKVSDIIRPDGTKQRERLDREFV